MANTSKNRNNTFLEMFLYFFLEMSKQSHAQIVKRTIYLN